MLPLIVADRHADAIRPKNAGKRKPVIVRRLNERRTIGEARSIVNCIVHATFEVDCHGKRID